MCLRVAVRFSRRWVPHASDNLLPTGTKTYDSVKGFRSLSSLFQTSLDKTKKTLEPKNECFTFPKVICYYYIIMFEYSYSKSRVFKKLFN